MSQLASDSLLWIKAELDSTLQHARHALETYVEAPTEKAPLQDCLKHLHQVQGTLRIVEVYGAATLAEEMEAVTQALLDERIKTEVDEAYEVLMRAILQMPDYLERVIHGQRDMPLALLSLLNDLRAVRGEPLLSESSLFAQNLTSRGAKADNLALASGGGDIIALAKKLRPKFQTALLGWFKSGDDDSLKTLGDIAGQLEHAASTPGTFQLWWIVGGIIEGLLDKGIEAGVSLKQLLGQVDRQIKRLLDNGEAALNDDPPTELVNNLLYYIGKATSNGERVAGIKESFKLTDLLPAEEQLALVRESLAGPNVNLMHTVGGALKEDISGVKDMLDIHVRMGKTDAAELEPALAVLKKVGDTLGMLELPRVRDEVERERQTLEQMVKGGKPAESTALLECAASLIHIELNLDNQLNDAARGSGSADTDDDDFQEVASAVVRECIINLARVKDALGEYIKTSNAQGLESLPGLLHQIQSGLQMLHEERAASLFDSLQAYLQQRIFEQSSVPPQQELDRMADAVVSVEFYLETIQQGRGAQPAMLDNAEACVEALGISPGKETSQQTPSPQDKASGETTRDQAGDALSLEPDDEAGEEISSEEGPSLDGLELSEEDAAQEISVPEVEQAEESGREPAPEATSAPAAPAKPALAVRPEEVDPEIVEIFLEESQEELASLREHFPRWKNTPENKESLATVRRSFHTLKGSGRMVGAELIGEFAWAIENMLNRVIDQTIEASDEVVDLIESAINALPELIEQLEAGTEPQTNVNLIMARADAASHGEPMPEAVEADDSVEEATGAETAEEAIEMPPVAAEDGSAENAGDDDNLAIETPKEPEAEPAAATLDPVLCDIFNREAQGHLLVLEEFVATGPAQPSEDLLRALHTLHGSSSMASIDAVTDTTAPVEGYARHAAEAGQTLDADGLQLIADLAAALREVLEALPHPDTAGVPVEDFVQRAASLQSALPEIGQSESAMTLGETSLSGADEPALDSDAQAPAMSERVPDEKPADKPAAEPVREFAVSELENFDPELAEIFQEEANDLLEAMDTSLHAWAQEKNDPEHVAALQRDLHTLKGGARMAGITPMGDLGHEMETVFTKVVDGHAPISEEMFALSQRAVDRLHRMLEQLYAGQAIVDGGDLIRDMHALLEGTDSDDETAGTDAGTDDTSADSEVISEASSHAAPVDIASAPTDDSIKVEEQDEQQVAAAAGEFERRSAPRIQQEMVRVRGELIESLLNAAGEVSIYRARLDQQMNTMGFNLTEMDNTVVRLREQLRKLEMETEAQIVYQWEKEGGDDGKHADFDPLEMDRYSLLQQLSRGLSETVSDLVSIQQLLSQQSREAETLLLQQSRINTELQDGLMRTRMLPFSRHAQRLRRIVRQTADETGKKAELKLVGAEGEMDRQILERILGPLEHMMRNAVIHGIEDPSTRERAGKSEQGSITIRLYREGSDVVMLVTDDGGGLNIGAIRNKAEKQGLIKSGAKLPDDDIIQFVLESGFSTAQTITQSAGRGVGMDVVNNEIRQLGGSLRIHSAPGKGAEFTIRLPFTLAITQALLVNVAEEAYAIPMPSIEGIVRIPRQDLLRYMQEESPVFSYGGMDYNLQYMGVLLGLGAPQLSEELDTVPVLLVRAGEHSSALVTEGMLGSREIVVKSVGPQITSIRGIAGATLLGDGSIVLILDAGGLVRAAATAAAQGEVQEQAERISEEDRAEEMTTAMVVDDSITVRRVTQRLLERYGMQVITAKDGVDALAVLQEQVPDVMLLDIEMPRMDGYELASNMRNDSRFKEVPIIMITSRTGEKHRTRAMEIGVNMYLGKPYQESELLEHIASLVGKFNPERTRWE